METIRKIAEAPRPGDTFVLKGRTYVVTDIWFDTVEDDPLDCGSFDETYVKYTINGMNRQMLDRDWEKFVMRHRKHVTEAKQGAD